MLVTKRTTVYKERHKGWDTFLFVRTLEKIRPRPFDQCNSLPPNNVVFLFIYIQDLFRSCANIVE